MSVLIRECMAGEVELLEASLPAGRAHAAHFARQVGGQCTYLVAWRDDTPLGVVVICWDGALPPELQAICPDGVEIRNLAVHPHHRRQGIGTALIDAGEERIRGRGHTCVALAVAEDNPDAARLYAALGYQDTAVRDVSRYNYSDDEGVQQEVVEHNTFLMKAVAPRVGH